MTKDQIKIQLEKAEEAYQQSRKIDEIYEDLKEKIYPPDYKVEKNYYTNKYYFYNNKGTFENEIDAIEAAWKNYENTNVRK